MRKRAGDRRTGPRFEVVGNLLGSLETSPESGTPGWSTVELVELSAGGLLFFSTVQLEAGRRGHLRVWLGDANFSAEVEVRRGTVRELPELGYKVSAMFVTVSEDSRKTLERFLNAGRNQG